MKLIPFALFMLLSGLLLTACISNTPTQTPTQMSPTGLSLLTDKTWIWTEFTNPREKSNIDHPENYTLQFLADGTVQIKADCNRGSSGYTVNGSNIQISEGAMTRAACLPESRSDDFIKYLYSAATYSVKDGSLNIDLVADGGTMTFSSTAGGN